LPNHQWQGIKDLLPGQKGNPGQTGRDSRLLIETVWWIAPTGSPWPDLLPAFGNWHRVVEAKKGFGNLGWNRSPMILICNNFSSIAQSFQLISLAQVEKRRVSGHRSVTWWIDHQD